MWTILQNSDYQIAIVPKAYDVRLDNVLVLENDRLYFITPLRGLDSVVYIDAWRYTIGHPVLEFFRYRNENKSNMFFVLNGQKREEWICCLCKKKFMGLTGTCKFEADNFDEKCSPEFEASPPPPLLEVKGGAYIPPKFFYGDYELYYRPKSLKDYDFSPEAINAVLRELSKP